MRKLTIKSDLGHFKNTFQGKIQQSHKVPPVSTVIGILKNIYGENINDFTFGYTIKYNNIFKDVIHTYKELNMNEKTFTDKKRFTTDICFIEYLVNPILTIYTDIGREEKINTVLNLGKTNCLARCKFEVCNIVKERTLAFNQYTDIECGSGLIKRLNVETVYNENKGCYDYHTKLFRLNDTFEAEYRDEDEKGIYLWKYRKLGDIECYTKNI